MKQNRAKIFAAAAAAVAVCIGGTQLALAYQAGGAYTPGSLNRAMQNNQLLFDQNGAAADAEQPNSEDQSFWQQDDAGNSQINRGNDGGYLFDRVAETNNTNQGQTLNMQPAEAAAEGAGSAGEVYDFVSEGEKADVVISGGEETPASGSSGSTSSAGSANNAGNANSGASDAGGQGDATVTPTPQPETPTPTPAPSKNDTVADPVTPSKGLPSIPDQKNWRYEEISSGNVPEDKIVNELFMVSTGLSREFYTGQTVDAETIFNSMDTYAAVQTGAEKNDLKIYYWTQAQLGKLIRIDAVSFDGGENWVSEFPVKIPQNAESMTVRLQYRYDESKDWNTAIAKGSAAFTLSKQRIYILKKALDDSATQISDEDILNQSSLSYDTERYQYVNLYSYQPDLMDLNVTVDDGIQIDQLFTGWEENGESVPFYYPLTAGRHILEPGKFVEVPEGYTVELKFSKGLNNTINAQIAQDLCYLQTLVNYGQGGSLWPDLPDFPDWPWFDFFGLFDSGDDDASEEEPEENILQVPDYVQAVDLSYLHTVDKLELPASVRYVNFDNLEVGKAFAVDEQNPYYCVQDGLLLNAQKTQILGIPSECTEITIPAGVTRVDVPATNSLQKIIFAPDCTEVPQMDVSSLEGCELQVSTLDMVGRVTAEYLDELNEGTITLNYTAAGDEPCEIENNCMVVNGRLQGIVECGDAVVLPNSVSLIGPGSMQYFNTARENLPANMLVMPRNGRAVTLQPGWADGTDIQTVICYSEKQMEAAQAALGEGITCQLAKVSKEGIWYVESADAPGSMMIVRAPGTISSFYGTLTAQSGEALTVYSICDYAFINNARLRWLQLPQSVKKIGYQAFKGCYALEGALIDSRDEITIGNRSFDDCWTMRFLASNARVGNVEQDYKVPVYTTYSTSYTLFVFCPSVHEGYEDGWTYFNYNEDNLYLFDHYEMVDCGGTKVLYHCDSSGNPWLALRSGLYMNTAELNLPATTNEIFSYAMAGLKGPSMGIFNDEGQALRNAFSLRGLEEKDNRKVEDDPQEKIDGIQNGLYIHADAFMQSDIGPDVTLPIRTTMEDGVFLECQKLENVTMQDGVALGEYVFNSCQNLKTVTIGEWFNALPNNMFFECDALRTIRFTASAPSGGLYLGYGTEFNFNANYDEAENLTIQVPQGSKDSYLYTWRYNWYGYNTLNELWENVSNTLYWQNYSEPTPEEILPEVKAKLLQEENKLRRMMRMEAVEEPTQMYYWYADENGFITLLEVSADVEATDFTPAIMDMPDGWCLDYIAKGAFQNCKQLDMVYIPATLIGIESGAFEGMPAFTLALGDEEFPPALLIEQDGVPFTFGSECEIPPIGGDPEHSALLENWTLPFAGYSQYSDLASAMTEQWQKEHPDLDPDSKEAQAEIAQLIKANLREAENTLRAMIPGMELLSDEDDPTVWKNIWQDDLTPDPGPGDGDGDDDLKPTPDPGDGDGDNEIIPDPDLGDGDRDLEPTPTPGEEDDEILTPSPAPGEEEDDLTPTPAPGEEKDDLPPSPLPDETISESRAPDETTDAGDSEETLLKTEQQEENSAV